MSTLWYHFRVTDTDRLFEEALIHLQAVDRAFDQLASVAVGGTAHQFHANLLRTWARRVYEQSALLVQRDPDETVERILSWLTDHPFKEPKTATEINEIVSRGLNMRFIYPAQLKRALLLRGYTKRVRAWATEYEPPAYSPRT